MVMKRREFLKRSAAAAVGLTIPSYLTAQGETLGRKLARYAAERKDLNGITRFQESPYNDLLSVIPDLKREDQSYIRTNTKVETSDFYAFIETQIYIPNRKRNYSDPRNSLIVRFKSKENDVEFTDKGIDSVIESGTASFQGQQGFRVAGVDRNVEVLDRASLNALETLTRFYESRR